MDSGITFTKVCGRKLSDFLIDDGFLTLLIKIESDGNFPDADNGVHSLKVSVGDLISFLAGLTLTPVCIDGGCSKIKVNVMTTRNGGSVRLKLEKWVERYVHTPPLESPGLHAKYLLWTNDGEYDDPTLDVMQDRAIANRHNTVLVSTIVKKLKTDSTYSMPRLAITMDMFTTLFAENVPISFLEGLALFQDIVGESDVAEVPN